MCHVDDTNKGKLIPTFWIKSSSKVISVLAQWTENYTGDIFITYIKDVIIQLDELTQLDFNKAKTCDFYKLLK